MKEHGSFFANRLHRRAFLKNGIVAAGAATVSTGLVGNALSAFGRGEARDLTRGDVAILKLLAAAEIIESDLWQQYSELGGINAPTTGYTAALQILDGDQPQYISDNTDDELSHAAFLNAYLKSKGQEEVDLSQFA